MPDSALLGIVNFSKTVLCAKDSLGHSVDVRVGTNSGTLTLPSLPEWREKEHDPLHKPLLGPLPARKWKRGDSLIEWGSPCSYPGGDALVEKALLQFDVEPSDLKATAQQVYDTFSNWLQLFEQYVVLLTRQNTRCRVSGGRGPGSVELLTHDSTNLRHIGNASPQTIFLEMGGADESLHLEQFREASRIASLGMGPRLEYRLMLEAYSARRNADYRKAIIEAATGLEICLTNRISEEFKKQSIHFGDGLLDKFRTLGGRFDLIRL